MINWFLKHWKVVLFIGLLLIGITIWISLTKEHFLSAFVIEYVNTWSEALTVIIMALVALAAFWAIKTNLDAQAAASRAQLKRNIRDWIEGALRDMPVEINVDELMKLRSIHSDSLGIMMDAKILGGKIGKDFDSVFKQLHSLMDSVVGHESTIASGTIPGPVRGSFGELKDLLVLKLGTLMDSISR